MLALEHALSGFGGLTSLVLSSTLASAAEWETEVKRLRDELPPDVVAVFDEHERAGTYDSPEYEAADAVFSDRHFYRGATLPPEIERMLPERGRESYRAMWGPNESTLTGALRGWDVRPRLGELDLPALVIRGRYDLSTESIAATLRERPSAGTRGRLRRELAHPGARGDGALPRRRREVPPRGRAAGASAGCGAGGAARVWSRRSRSRPRRSRPVTSMPVMTFFPSEAASASNQAITARAYPTATRVRRASAR